MNSKILKAMREKIDIVDDNDNIIRQDSRLKVYLQKLLHRGSAIIICKNNTHKEILLQKRSKHINFPGKLCIAGGHLISGDSYLQCAKKELQEEMFHKKSLPANIKFEELFKIRKSTDNNPEFITLYRITYPGPFNPDPFEVESYFFEGLDNILKDINESPAKYTETTSLLIKEYTKRKN